MASNHTGLSPSMASRSRELGRRRARDIPYRLQLGPRPDFKSELLPLHSPLLGQSLLVSFPPLIDMLKFSGYSYLIRGQPCGKDALASRLTAEVARGPRAKSITTLGFPAGSPLYLRACAFAQRPNARLGLRGEMTLGQACPPEYWRAQCAFKDSMIH